MEYRLPACLVLGLDEEEAYHLVLLAGGDDAEILVLAEHALSGAQRFQLHAAMRAGASANGVRKVVFTPPRMSALGADVRAVRPLDGVMFEAMAESVSLCVAVNFGSRSLNRATSCCMGVLGFIIRN